MPDVLNTYGENFSRLGLMNNQTLTYDVRLMVTNNDYDPKIYKITKVTEMVPQGVIKLTFKQDDFNEMTDNTKLRICDYWTPQGNLKVNIQNSDNEEDTASYTSSISWQTKDENGELVSLNNIASQHLSIGKVSYFKADFFIDNEKAIIDPEWKLILINNQDYSEDEVEYYTNLIAITEFDESVISVKAAKAGSLSGKKYRLSVSDKDGNYYSYIDLEVT